MSINSTLQQLITKQDLSEESAFSGFQQLFRGSLSPAQSGALLASLRTKGETSLELHSAVKAALEQAKSIPSGPDNCIDTCGTGGDGQRSFNCSTCVALFLADMGYKVVKHGNRAVSSSCGSADIAEALEIPFLRTPEEVNSSLQKTNFAFIFAPYFHPAFAHVSPIRQELGIPTLFNLIGPLLNPARPTHQLLGVGEARYMLLIAEVLAMTGIKHAAVVHGAGNFDELTPCGVSKIIYVRNHQCIPEWIDPSAFGMEKCLPRDLACTDKQDALDLMQTVLTGRAAQAIQDMVSLNLGVAVYLLENDFSLAKSIHLARKKVAQGLQKEKFNA